MADSRALLPSDEVPQRLCVPAVHSYCFHSGWYAGLCRVRSLFTSLFTVGAKALGRSRDYPIRGDWETVKEDVMRRALEAKFTQHSSLSILLLSTGGRQLQEASPYDNYWGMGNNGKGKNRLGQLLMELRDSIRHSAGAK